MTTQVRALEGRVGKALLSARIEYGFEAVQVRCPVGPHGTGRGGVGL